jgi:lathosterol oxidase
MIALRTIIGILCVTGVLAHINDIIVIPGLRVPSEFHTRVLIVDTFADFLWANLYIG